MSVDIETVAEQHAVEATEMEEFNQIDIKNIKSNISDLLSAIGSEGVFDEYTKHNIDHINGMLENLEWIIPEETKENMHSADWLMLVLSIYFHDLGLLVTPREFENRDETDFETFIEQELFNGEKGRDYEARIREIPDEKQERFLYQEYVRANHAKRIRDWINGDLKEQGGTEETVNEINSLLEDLPRPFVKDLAKICESHHLNDLDDTDKYTVSSSYGRSEGSTVNLHYCAILLRVSDLLHITSDRAPSIMFRVINPVDPKGQDEWAKQEAVSDIRPKPSTLVESQDESTETDTGHIIEVSAYFEQEQGFFSLIDYLNYAQEEISQCYEWVEQANELYPTELRFPWKEIDDSGIETEGFERETFEFEVDQRSILDLLTGHTLYNDTDVAIRELVQNGIDATRVKSKEESETYDPTIDIDWDDDSQILEIHDNGTGMSQEIIENYLLKVGSSRYQSQQFKDDFPDFHPISEFGIGILSAFMIADKVDIFTCHESDEPPRQISFRSVHGRYLIRHLNENDKEFNKVSPHGTTVRLKLRPSTDIENIRDICEKWFVCPPCNINLHQDGDNISIGHDSLRDAMLEYIDNNTDKITDINDDSEIKIKEKRYEGMTICYPVRKSKYFDDWRFVRGRFNDEIGRARSKNAESDIDPLGTSIEGIRVTSSTPGYDEKPIIAMANLTGGQRPRTNVARTDLDSGDHFNDTLSDIYTAYLEHIKEETDQLYTNRSYSLAWAVESAQFIIKPLGNEKPTDENIFEECLKEIPTILIEENSERNPATRAELESTDEVWSVDSSLLRRADQLFRDLPMSKSYQNLIDGLDLPLTDLPDGKVLCNINSPRFPDATLEDRSPEKIHVIGDEKRVDIKWQTQKQDQSNFEIFPGTSLQRGSDNMKILIQNESIQTKGIDNEVAIMSAGRLIILQDAKICDLLQNITSKLDPSKRIQKGLFNQFASLIIEYINSDGKKSEPSELERVFKDEFGHRGGRRESTELIDIDYAELLQGLNELHDNTFDPEIWFDRFSEDQ